MRCWVLLVTYGTIVEYPPEIYRSHRSGVREARRWAWILADYGRRPISQPFDGRWEAGDRDVRLVPASYEPTGGNRSYVPWVGIHWTTDGYPDPEAIVLSNQETAYDWVLEPSGSVCARDVDVDEWTISAAFGSPEDESYSVAHLAKAFLSPEAEPKVDVDYELELTGTFVQSISGRVSGPPGLGRPGIERRIEEHWAELSMEPDVLLESSWELDSFRETNS